MKTTFPVNFHEIRVRIKIFLQKLSFLIEQRRNNNKRKKKKQTNKGEERAIFLD